MRIFPVDQAQVARDVAIAECKRRGLTGEVQALVIAEASGEFRFTVVVLEQGETQDDIQARAGRLWAICEAMDRKGAESC